MLVEQQKVLCNTYRKMFIIFFNNMDSSARIMQHMQHNSKFVTLDIWHNVNMCGTAVFNFLFVCTDLGKGQRSPHSAPPSWNSQSCSCTWALPLRSHCFSGSAYVSSPGQWGTLLWHPPLEDGTKDKYLDIGHNLEDCFFTFSPQFYDYGTIILLPNTSAYLPLVFVL